MASIDEVLAFGGRMSRYGGVRYLALAFAAVALGLLLRRGGAPAVACLRLGLEDSPWRDRDKLNLELLRRLAAE